MGASVKLLVNEENKAITSLKVHDEKGKQLSVTQNSTVTHRPTSFHFRMPNGKVTVIAISEAKK